MLLVASETAGGWGVAVEAGASGAGVDAGAEIGAGAGETGDAGGVCALALIWAVAPAFAAEQFETRLSASPLTDGTRVNISGEGRAHATLDGNTLIVTADFHGLGSAATTA